MKLSSKDPARPVLRAPLRYIDDRVLTTDKSVWTYVEPLQARAGMQTNAEIENYVLGNSRPLARLVTGTKPVNCHLRIMNIPAPVSQWRDRALERAPHHTLGWERTLDLQSEVSVEHYEPHVVLGVEIADLTQQETFFTSGPFKMLRSARDRFENAAGVDGEIVTVDQLSRWHARADQIRSTLSPIGAGASAETVQAHILNLTNPGMPVPRANLGPTRRFGPGLERILLNDPVDIHNRQIAYLDINDQPIMYSAYVPVSRTEEEWTLGESEPWLYACSEAGFPVDWSIRFKVIPNAMVKKDLQRGGAHAKDMAAHMNEAGKEIPIALAETVQRLDELEYETAKSRLPGLYGQFVAQVWATTPDVLAQRVQTLREVMADFNIAGEWTSGDQREFAMQSCLGTPYNYRPYEQHTNLWAIFGGAPTWSDEVGDRVDPSTGRGWKGGRIGETELGTPVHFDPHVAPARNTAPGFVVAGQSGSGKTNLFGKLAGHMAQRGATIDLIDPKPDIIDPSGERFRLPDFIKYTTGKDIQIVDVAHSAPGSLDPFVLAESRQQGLLLAQSTLSTLLDVRDHSTRTALAAALNREADADIPSIGGVLATLTERGRTDPAAASLAEQLNLYKRMDFARLLIGEGKTNVGFRREPGLFTAITTRGLRLPAAAKPLESYDPEDRIAALVLSLLVRQCARSLTGLDLTYPKALLVDEAHIVTATEAGRAMIGDAFSMLRSRNGVVGLASQTLRGFTGSSDDEADRVMANVSTVFAFRQTKPAEAERILHELKPDITTTGGWSVSELQNLPTGECIMRDIDRRLGRVRVDRSIASERFALETNPDELPNISVDVVNDALADEYGVGPWYPASTVAEARS